MYTDYIINILILSILTVSIYIVYNRLTPNNITIANKTIRVTYYCYVVVLIYVTGIYELFLIPFQFSEWLELINNIDLSDYRFIPLESTIELRMYAYEYLFILNVLGNMIMFLPLGIFLPTVFNIDKFYLAFIYGFICSGIIEIIQLFTGRIFDVDDIIWNSFGVLIGYLIYKLIKIFLLTLKKLQTYFDK